MKRTYDVIASGEGISGLFACALLTSKGLTCLWVDNSSNIPNAELLADTPMLITETFSRGLLEPILSKIDKRLMKSIEPEHGLVLQLMDSSEAITREPGITESTRSIVKKSNETYLSLIKKSSTKPQRYLRQLGSRAVTHESWEDIIGSAFSSPEAGRLAQMKAHVSTFGMCAIKYGKIKTVLSAYLKGNGSDSIRDPSAVLVVNGKEVLGMQLEEAVYKGLCYLTEDPPEQRPYHGFYFYGQCRARLGMFPKGVGDLVLVSPPDDLKYPIIVKVDRNQYAPKITIQTRVNLEPGLASFTEILSWASGMITKRLSRLMPFLSVPLQAFEVVNPMGNDMIRPWFRFSEDVKPPSLFHWRRYITPIERIYACDRDKYACLGNEGDFFWGVCIANAILKGMGRSDLVTI